MMTLLLTLVLGLEAPGSDPLAEASILYDEGSALYEAADYLGAIAKFTEALRLVGDEGSDAVRLSLLYNIASAHEQQFTIDKDVSHLRQALALYKRYEDFVQRTGDLGEELDVSPKISRLEKRLETHDRIEHNRTEASEPTNVPPPPPTQEVNRRPRNIGIGLVVSGGVATIGGIVLAVLGSQYEPNARDEVNKLADLGIPMDHPAWAEGDEFIGQEKRKGNILMGVGGTVAVVGIIGVAVGTSYLVKSKRLRNGQAVRAQPFVSPGFAGVQFSGKF